MLRVVTGDDVVEVVMVVVVSSAVVVAVSVVIRNNFRFYGYHGQRFVFQTTIGSAHRLIDWFLVVDLDLDGDAQVGE